jgi:hypothetical protein
MYAVAHNQAYVEVQVELVSWIIVLPPRMPSMPSYPPPFHVARGWLNLHRRQSALDQACPQAV